MDDKLWQEAERLIAANRRFIITAHANPDGDALGSEAALRLHLLARGKEARLVNPSPVPANLDFLEYGTDTVVIPDGDETTPIPEADVLVVLDASNWRRMGELGKRLMRLTIPSLVLDHHPESRDPAGTLRLIDTGAAATGELVYRLIERAGGGWSRAIARALYAAIMTDTGSFRFSNTTPATHRIAAHLLELGVEPRTVYGDVYERRSVAQVTLLGKMLAGMTVAEGGRVALLAVSAAMLAESGLTRADLEGFVEFTYLIALCEVGIQLVETGEGTTRVSLRSRERVNVGKIAERLGGGGHEHAAGLVFARPLEEARRVMLEECRKGLVENGGGEIR